MRKLVRSEELQDIAQMWADQCTLGHDTNRDILKGEKKVLVFKGLEPWDVTVIGISCKFSCQNNIVVSITNCDQETKGNLSCQSEGCVVHYHNHEV